MSNFAANLKALRIAANMTQDELSKKLGISRSAIGMYESGERQPDFETLEAIADTFNVDMNTLHGRTESPTIQNDVPLDKETTHLVNLYHNANEQAQKTAVLVLEQGQQKPNLKIVPREPAYIEREAVAFEGEVKRSKATPEQSAEATRLIREIEKRQKD